MNEFETSFRRALETMAAQAPAPGGPTKVTTRHRRTRMRHTAVAATLVAVTSISVASALAATPRQSRSGTPASSVVPPEPRESLSTNCVGVDRDTVDVLHGMVSIHTSPSTARLLLDPDELGDGWVTPPGSTSPSVSALRGTRSGATGDYGMPLPAMPKTELQMSTQVSVVAADSGRNYVQRQLWGAACDFLTYPRRVQGDVIFRENWSKGADSAYVVTPSPTLGGPTMSPFELRASRRRGDVVVEFRLHTMTAASKEDPDRYDTTTVLRWLNAVMEAAIDKATGRTPKRIPPLSPS